MKQADISVELIDYMGSDLAVANTARVSFNKWKDEFEEGKDDRLINYLAKHEHLSPFRHNQISLRCKVPVFLARQLGKHQAGLSWNEVSRRYVDADIEWYVPDNWRSRPVDGIKQGSGSSEVNSITIWNEVEAWTCGVKEAYYQHITDSSRLYDSLIESGVAPEMARMVLPQSMMVDYIWTGNLLAFFHVYKLRAGEGAQLEAKEFAQKLEAVIEPLFPYAWCALKGTKDETPTH